MASIVTSLVTVSAKASSTPDIGPQAAHQGGILEGANPAHYDSKNRITIFIIQVISPLFLNQLS